MPIQKFKKLKHFNLPGHAHELTFTCFDNQRFLASELACQWLIESLQKARARHQIHLWPYVIMPNHVHIILFPTRTDYDIGKVLWSIKYSVSLRAINYFRDNPETLVRMTDRQPNGRTAYRFWQRGGGYDRNVIEPETIRSSIEYLHLNPVRKKLVEKPENWKWSSAGFYAGQNQVALKMDVEHLPFAMRII